jgi:metallopeptidase MepB
MIQGLLRTNFMNSALFILCQLHLGIFNMTVHTAESHEEIENLNIPATYNSLLTNTFPLDRPQVLSHRIEWGHGYARSQHLLGEYDAG